MFIRLQKYMAEAGIASRRASEAIIAAGLVEINGQVVREMGAKLDPARDNVSVDGQKIRPKSKLYIALHKPPGYICSRNDPQGRKVVGQLLPSEWTDLHPVGRLDYNSEGLLFLTNDGEFSLQLTHPRYGVLKKYLVTVRGRVEPDTLHQMTRGIFLDGERLRAHSARILRSGAHESLVEMELSEGKNREVRRLFESQSITVEELKRIQIGRIKLGELKRGKWRILSPTEVKTLTSSEKKGPTQKPASRKTE